MSVVSQAINLGLVELIIQIQESSCNKLIKHVLCLHSTFLNGIHGANANLMPQLVFLTHPQGDYQLVDYVLL